MKIRHWLLTFSLLIISISSSAQITGTFTDARDGIIYKTVKIGTQTWMAENLQATKYRNGDVISNVSGNAQWVNLLSGAYCDYKNTPENSRIYGRLYNWYAVTDNRKLAPEGWHVPSAEEWNTLAIFLGGAVGAGGKLKESGTTHWKSPNTGATNETGFTALPGGCCFGGTEQFYEIGERGYWWTSTADNNSDAQHRIMYLFNYDISSYSGNKYKGYSVRCIKD